MIELRFRDPSQKPVELTRMRLPTPGRELPSEDDPIVSEVYGMFGVVLLQTAEGKDRVDALIETAGAKSYRYRQVTIRPGLHGATEVEGEEATIEEARQHLDKRLFAAEEVLLRREYGNGAE